MTDDAHMLDPRLTGGAAPSTLAALLERQHGLLVRLDSLSLAQGACIDNDDDRGLLEVLGDRQAVVDRLAEVIAALAPFRANWGQFCAMMGPEERERAQGQARTISSLAACIAERDGRDRARLEARRDRIAGELAGLVRTRGALSAYRAPDLHDAPSYQDREG
jgi:hypothetical protein